MEIQEYPPLLAVGVDTSLLDVLGAKLSLTAQTSVAWCTLCDGILYSGLLRAEWAHQSFGCNKHKERKEAQPSIAMV